MIVFNQLVFDSYLSGTTDVFTDASFDDLLGSVDRLTIGGEIRAITGNLPTIGIQYQNSPDGARWSNQSSTVDYGPFLASTGVGGPLGPLRSLDSNPKMGFVRLRIFLGDLNGGMPAMRLRLWVVGRTPVG